MIAPAAAGSPSETGRDRALRSACTGQPSRPVLPRPPLATRCASRLREAPWGMISALHPPIPFDDGAYTAENLARFEHAYADHTRRYP